MNGVTQQQLREQFNYNPSTGVFTRTSGREAGSLDTHGYRQIKVLGRLHLAHRLAWVYVNGPIPDGMFIDHINRDRADNRIDNLRLATKSLNGANCSVVAKSGLPRGVRKSGRKYAGQIMFAGKKHHLGVFSTPQEAHAMYRRAFEMLHEVAV